MSLWVTESSHVKGNAPKRHVVPETHAYVMCHRQFYAVDLEVKDLLT